MIQLSGRIESYESDLGAKVGGQVESVAVREGDLVNKGQVVAKLDDKELLAQLEAAKATVSAAQQKVTEADLQIEVVESQVREAQLTLEQSQGDTAGQVNQSEAAVATAQAQLSSAQAQAKQAASALELARADRDRFATLVAQGAISQQQFDQVQTQFETARDTLAAQQAAVAAARQQINAAEGALTQSQTSQLNPAIRTAQVNRTQKQQAQAQLAAAKAELEQAQAAQSEIQARLNDLEEGTIAQVYASDLSSTEWLLGKELAYLIVGLGEALIVMTVAAILFGLRFRGDPTTLAVGVIVYLAASVAFGLFVGARAANQTGAVQGTAIAGFLAALLLSGFIYRIDNIPFPLSLLSNVIPARYFIEITRDAFVRGTGWVGVWYAPLMIALIGGFFFRTATKVLKRMQFTD